MKLRTPISLKWLPDFGHFDVQSPRDVSRRHPKLGLIDDGVSDVVGDWVIGRWNILADDDVDASHGTFIAGLLVAGSALNGAATLAEVDGVEVYDGRVYPRDPTFSTYYLTLDDFFDEVENAVIEARNQHGVRIFNFSMNVVTPVTPDHYSRWASRIDRFDGTVPQETGRRGAR